MLANAGRLGKGPKGDRYALIGGRSIPSSRDRLQGRLSHEAALLITNRVYGCQLLIGVESDSAKSVLEDLFTSCNSLCPCCLQQHSTVDQPLVLSFMVV